jgi:hypothetical protein
MRYRVIRPMTRVRHDEDTTTGVIMRKGHDPVWLSECLRCGAVVVNEQRHDEWHEQIERTT